MLQRISELCVQAANGTNASADVKSISNEITALKQEMERIASTTDFNGKMMLSGSSTEIFVGYTNVSANIIKISGSNLKTAVSKLGSISNQAGARSMLAKVSTAIESISAMRSDFGAVQNRLEHTIDNLDNIVENVTAAESRLRDTDMADEMVKYSKNNILIQAGQSMLAQANQATQGVLSLLQ
jgi:flagellin